MEEGGRTLSLGIPNSTKNSSHTLQSLPNDKSHRDLRMVVDTLVKQNVWRALLNRLSLCSKPCLCDAGAQTLPTTIWLCQLALWVIFSVVRMWQAEEGRTGSLLPASCRISASAPVTLAWQFIALPTLAESASPCSYSRKPGVP